jgi:hypothetical protein
MRYVAPNRDGGLQVDPGFIEAILASNDKAKKRGRLRHRRRGREDGAAGGLGFRQPARVRHGLGFVQAPQQVRQKTNSILVQGMPFSVPVRVPRGNPFWATPFGNPVSAIG